MTAAYLQKLWDSRSRRVSKYTVEGIGEVYIKSMSEAVRARIELAPRHELRSRLVVCTLCDADGNLVFDEKRDLPGVLEMDSALISKLSDYVLKHCGLGEMGDDEDANDEELEAAKN